jgi:ketosteroid isomerase-like protein
MSRENVEVVREVVEAFNRWDADALIACLDADVEWEEISVPGLRRVYRGGAEVREWIADLVGVWESFHIEVVEIAEGDDGRVFVGLLVTGRGAGSGVATELRVWPVFSVADGKIARRQMFETKDQALDAAGLRE